MVQKFSLSFIANQMGLIILLVDKHLGPMMVSRYDYGKAMMYQNLTNIETYDVTKEEAT